MIEPVRTRANPMWPQPPMTEKRPIPWFTMILIGGLLFLVGHTLDTTVTVTDWSTDFGTTADSIAEGSPVRRLGFLLLGFWGAVVIITRQARYTLRLNGLLPWLMIGFVVWAGLTLLWADDFPLAGRRFVTLCLVTVAVVAVLQQFSLREIILFITLSALVYALIGIVAELAYGSFHPFAAEYRFAGTQHPNRQGMNLARLVLGAFCLSRMRVTGHRLFIVIAAVGLVLLFLTRSRTAFGAALIALTIFAAVRASPLRLTAMVLAVGALGLLTLFLIQNGLLSTPWELILMGRKAHTAGTLSGRTELWAYLWTFVVERPVLGYGYHSFMSPERAGDMPTLVAWGVSESHSLYFEIALGTGAVGLGLFVAVLLGSIGRALRWASRGQNPAHAFLAAYLVFIVLNGVMAATTMFPDPKLVAFLALGYVLLRDPEGEVTEAGSVPDAQWGQFPVALHRGRGPGMPEWPPVPGSRVGPHYPQR